MGLMVRAGLGLEPWSVFNQGIARHTGLTIGTVTIVTGALILLLWVPLRQRPGLGTISNVVILGLVMDATLELVPAVRPLAVRIPLLVTAVLLNGAATGLYLSARFGAGPRDGLMTGLHRRTGRPLRLVRTCIELTVLVAGFALGGSVGVGTVVYALAIGPLAQFFLRRFAIEGLAERPSLVVARSPEPSPGRAILP
ncbi:YitT family protein [Streptomyces sp. NPDC090442]|uniref:membrane protein YczE n=1 Tax=Streptomyces sp. NPDC090442 TaxID=3365962 RepID=UPI0037FD9094